MTAETVCIAALPNALPAALAQPAADEVTVRPLALSEGMPASSRDVTASILAARLLPRLFREPAQAGTAAQAALSESARVLIVLPAGRYDDGVWAPIIERILLGLGAAGSGPREIVLAWSGFDPFLAPFGQRADAVWNDPRLAPTLLAVLERSARSLTAVLDAAGHVRRGLIRFQPGEDEAAPARAALALA